MSNLAHTPDPPYYAVIFTSIQRRSDAAYARTAQRMEALARQQRGFLGMEHARDVGCGITVSYWQDLRAIAAWKQDLEHHEAQRLGQRRWYQRYAIRVAKVERAYAFDVAAQ